MSQATLRTLGGSIALTIPKKLLESVGLGVGDRVSVAIDKGRIVVEPVKHPRHRLADLLSRCKGRTFAVDQDWERGRAVGPEVL